MHPGRVSLAAAEHLAKQCKYADSVISTITLAPAWKRLLTIWLMCQDVLILDHRLTERSFGFSTLLRCFENERNNRQDEETCFRTFHTYSTISQRGHQSATGWSLRLGRSSSMLIKYLLGGFHGLKNIDQIFIWRGGVTISLVSWLFLELCDDAIKL